MVALSSLWVPILLSSVIVFAASSVIHMAPLWHKGDYPKMPREAEALEALIRELHDPQSPNYHHWLSASEFGARFAPAASDIAAVTG